MVGFLIFEKRFQQAELHSVFLLMDELFEVVNQHALVLLLEKKFRYVSCNCISDMVVLFVQLNESHHEGFSFVFGHEFKHDPQLFDCQLSNLNQGSFTYDSSGFMLALRYSKCFLIKCGGSTLTMYSVT